MQACSGSALQFLGSLVSGKAFTRATSSSSLPLSGSTGKHAAMALLTNHCAQCALQLWFLLWLDVNLFMQPYKEELLWITKKSFFNVEEVLLEGSKKSFFIFACWKKRSLVSKLLEHQKAAKKTGFLASKLKPMLPKGSFSKVRSHKTGIASKKLFFLEA